MTQRLTITLPWPDTSLMPNRKNGRHWGNTQAAKVRARQDGFMGAKIAMDREPFAASGRLSLRITFAAPDKRRRDIDNLLACIKPQLDGIAQALGVDDSQFRPVILDDSQDQSRQGFVTVEVGQ